MWHKLFSSKKLDEKKSVERKAINPKKSINHNFIHYSEGEGVEKGHSR